MIDLNSVRLNGKLNQGDGFSFQFIQSKQGYTIVSLLIDTISKDKRKSIRITMEPDTNHRRPHIHVDRHKASFFLDGTQACGKVSNSQKRVISDWIKYHRSDLENIWQLLKEQRTDYDNSIVNVRNRWEVNGVFFDGSEPERKETISNVQIWYNGTLEYNKKNNQIICTKEMCVLLPNNFQEESMSFISRIDSVQIRKEKQVVGNH